VSSDAWEFWFSIAFGIFFWIVVIKVADALL